MPFTTSLEIVNAALRRAGASRDISAVDDTTPGGAIAGDVYASERDDLLRAYTWNFAVARADLSTTTAPTFGFTNSFGVPADWLRTIGVYDHTDPTNAVRYQMETVNVASTWTRVIVTDASDVYLRYIRQVTDVALMTACFQQMLILRMARVFAIGLAASNTLLGLFDAELKEYLARAVQTDEIENYPETIPSGHWAADIVNAALRKIGIGRGTDTGSKVPASVVILDTLNQELDDLLRQHTWNFATARTKLEQVKNNTPLFEWTYAYRLPSDWLRTISVHGNDAGAGQAEYKHESMWPSSITNNDDFDTDTVWTKGTGWTISGGVATHASGSASDLSQTISPTAGGVYRLIFTISGRTAGTITPKFTGGSTVTGNDRNADGIWVEELTAVSGNNALVLSASSGFNGSIDNTSLVRIDTGAFPAILSNEADVYLRYVRRVKDASLMPGAFKNVLSLKLAKVLAAGFPEALNLLPMLEVEYTKALRQAKSIDGIEDNIDQFPVGSWVTSRWGSDASWFFPR